MAVMTEYELLTESAGLVDRSSRGKLIVRGADAAEFLQGQLTNDIEGLSPGGGCYAALLNHKGKLRADMRILRGEDWIWIDTEPQAAAVVAQTVDMYGIGRDVGAEDVTEARAILSLVGPEARAALEVPPPEPEHAFCEGEHGLYVSTDVGVDVLCDASSTGEVTTALGVEAVSDEAAECVRIERGRPRFGYDMTTETIPQEAGINDRAVDFEKGCYVGQETVARLHYKGKPNRHLRGLRAAAPVERGDAVVLEGREVGSVGSACASPGLGPVALALLRREAEPGATVLVGEGEVEAQVEELPFSGT